MRSLKRFITRLVKAKVIYGRSIGRPSKNAEANGFSAIAISRGNERA
jgi:hypothetical protein